ncbi:hypothetical protein LCGC14_0942160 [marine sediment metagenome]|uniref:Uncharacterized protein n=1 Tax=marine sediment metagenome TaxID=412755 RepID=A0A0F9P5V1_9ZZZZ
MHCQNKEPVSPWWEHRWMLAEIHTTHSDGTKSVLWVCPCEAQRITLVRGP